MSIVVNQTAIGSLEKPTLRKPGGRESIEIKKARLKKATKEFESFFVMHMLKSMRSTIPEGGLIDGGLGKDVYTSLFDQELAKDIAGNSSRSLAQVLYRSLEKHIEATAAGEEPTNIRIDTKINPEKPGLTVPGRSSAGVKETARPTDISLSAGSFRSSRPKISADPVLGKYGKMIEQNSREQNLDPKLIYAVMMVESGGRSDVVSPKGAKGLMQLTDATASDMGVVDSLNPGQNIAGGAKYLRRLLDKYDGDIRLTLAAYNAGPGTVSKYNGVPPYSETRQYIEKVLTRLQSPTGGAMNKTLG